MKKYGGFIPGIRAGKPTEDYLSYVLSRITLPGALYLGSDRPDPADRPRADQRQPELPVRRHLDPDHGRRRARHGEADREPAPAAQLRRIPPIDASDPHGPAGSRQGHPGAGASPSTSACPAISTGDIFRANVSAGHRARASRPSATWTPATTSPTRSPTRWSATGSTSPTPSPASCSTATRARPRRSRSSTA